MDAWNIPAEWGLLGAIVFSLFLFVLGLGRMLFKGVLVTKPVHDDLREQRDWYRQAYEDEAASRREESKQISTLIAYVDSESEDRKLIVSMLQAIRSAVSGPRDLP